MKLNLGSGKSGIAALNVISSNHIGWKHIDICPHYDTNNGYFECYDITQGIKEADNSVDEIWMGDFFEHLLRIRAIYVMNECYRVLKPGGRLRVCVPDMEKAMLLWLASEGEEHYQYGRIIFGEQDDVAQKNEIADSHKYGYTEKSLKQLLSLSSFINIERILIHNVWFELSMSAYK